VAVVSSGAITDPVPAFLAVAANQASDPETLRRLVSQRFEALFARSAPTGLVPGPETYGYRVLTEPQAERYVEQVQEVADAAARELDCEAYAVGPAGVPLVPIGFGPTPAAALRDLAVKLREVKS